MYRGFAHADEQYSTDLEAARQAYKAAGGNDSPQASVTQQYPDCYSTATALDEETNQ
jgi:hypothetical protein